MSAPFTHPVRASILGRWILLCCFFFLAACSTHRVAVPIGVVPDAREVTAEDEQYGHEVLAQLSEKYELDRDDSRINRVRSIVDRLTQAANADKVPWNVYVLVDDTYKNSAATRGNYVFVWTGILGSTENDAELATVLAHEIGHVLAGHPAPDPSEEVRSMIPNVVGQVAGQVVSTQGQYGILADVAAAIIEQSLTATLVNPEAQRKELEADQIGLFLMARAGYDPSEAIQFWERAKQDPSFGDSSLEFLSTHPSSTERLRHLKELLPEALSDFDDYTEKIYNRTKHISKGGARNIGAKNGKREPRAWFVHTKYSDVFMKPDPKSTVVGSLPHDTKVSVARRETRWTKISKPLPGYIRSGEISQR